MKQTPLHSRHVDAGARMIDFGGWDMPVTYSDIATEHAAVRNEAGLFDLGHMGRVAISGPDARELVQKAQTNDLERNPEGQIRYALLLQDDAGVIDDILVHNRGHDIFLVVNASNRETVVARLEELRGDLDCKIDDQSESLSMIAIQGPKSAAIVQKLTAIDLEGLGYYRLVEGEIDGVEGMITRTGYTGEDGFELYAPADAGREALGPRPRGRPRGPASLRPRRARHAAPRGGHAALRPRDRSPEINPFEAGLNFGVRLKKPDYPGREVAREGQGRGPGPQALDRPRRRGTTHPPPGLRGAPVATPKSASVCSGTLSRPPSTGASRRRSSRRARPRPRTPRPSKSTFAASVLRRARSLFPSTSETAAAR